MNRSLAAVSLVVRDYDEAIAFYTKVMGFTLVEDEPMGNGKRWVVVAIGDTGTRLVLARAANDEQLTRVGNQTGGRVFMFLHTDDFERDYQRWRGLGEACGVKFLETPRNEKYGRVVVMQDLYGNKWDVIEPRRS
jgi:catechol 2,3-dioxygenase-like lactoylglutathione lyase family enzyme